MTRKKTHQPKVDHQATTPSANVSSAAPKKGSNRTWLRLMRKLPYTLTFICLYFFVTLTYGDVFTRTVQESYICSEPGTMDFLTQQDYGSLYVLGRYALLIFHSVWFGGLIFTLMLLGIGKLIDHAFRLPLWLRGLGNLIPVGLLFYFASQGIQLYYKSEPSLFILQTIGTLLVALVLALVLPKIFKHSHSGEEEAPKSWRKIPVGLLVTLLSYSGLQAYAHSIDCENTILTADMQNKALENDISTLAIKGLSAQQPSRSVAAYNAIGLLHTDALLEHVFDISYHFPEVKVNMSDGSGEYGIFMSDCNFFSGLLNASYRSAMDHIVMDGPKLYYLKRMALCAILKQEKALAEKYLTIIGKVPFEKDFVETYRPYLDNPELINQNYIFSRILKLTPTEQRFEQNYRNPTFLGYYTRVLQGNNLALAPSIAACLYSKDLPNASQRAYQMKAMNEPLPLSVMEAMAILSRKNPDIVKYYPELNPATNQFQHPAIMNVNNFFIDIQTYFKDKYNNAPDWRSSMSKELSHGINDELREILSKKWLGHFVYYYYCENVVQKNEVKKQQEHSVN